MTDVAPALHERIVRLMQSGLAVSPKIEALMGVERKNYKNAYEYAAAVAKEAERAMRIVLTEGALPEGTLFFNIADRTVRPLMEEVQGLVAGYCEQVQSRINADAGIGIKAIRPGLNEDRVAGMINKLASYENITDGKWLFDAPMENYSESVVVDSIRENAEFQYSAGLEPLIIRSQSGRCCDWCDALIGTYRYRDLEDGDMVWARHDYCRCTLDYVPGDGTRKGAWGSRVGGLTAYSEWKQKKEQQRAARAAQKGE